MNNRADLDTSLPECDDEDCLLDSARSSRAHAPVRAARDNLALTDAHWQVIDFIRDWYAENEGVPEAHRAIRHLAANHDGKGAAKRALLEHFALGCRRQACRIARMREPLKPMRDV